MAKPEDKSVAVVGASSDRAKYGNKSLRAHAAEGWIVYPINPKVPVIEGLTAYRTLGEVPGAIRRVSMYVPPTVGLKLLDEIAAVEPKEVFFNPGAESPELIAAATVRGLPVIAACSIVDLGRSPAEFV